MVLEKLSQGETSGVPLGPSRAIVFVPDFADIGDFPSSFVETGESILGSDNKLVRALARDIGGDAIGRSAVVSRRSITV